MHTIKSIGKKQIYDFRKGFSGNFLALRLKDAQSLEGNPNDNGKNN